MSRAESTSETILTVAASLFSRQGFHGTSTRQIAEAVNIRQPSLFHHFASKTEIARALFEYDFQRSPLLRGELPAPDAPPARQLYELTYNEVLVESTSRYDLRGLFLGSLVDEPEFQQYRQAYENARLAVQAVVERGIASGDFVDQSPRLVVEVIEAVLNQAIRWAGEERELGTPEALAAMVLRMVLKDPRQLPALQRAFAEVSVDA